MGNAKIGYNIGAKLKKADIMQAYPDELLEHSRDAVKRARKYLDQAKTLEDGGKDKKILEARAQESLAEARRWAEMANKLVAS